MDLIRLTARFGKRYSGKIALVIVLQLLTTLATLYLPDLNADIINNGVAQADVPYIWRVGRTMLVVALVQIAAAICTSATTSIVRPTRQMYGTSACATPLLMMSAFRSGKYSVASVVRSCSTITSAILPLYRLPKRAVRRMRSI